MPKEAMRRMVSSSQFVTSDYTKSILIKVLCITTFMPIRATSQNDWSIYIERGIQYNKRRVALNATRHPDIVFHTFNNIKPELVVTEFDNIFYVIFFYC